MTTNVFAEIAPLLWAHGYRAVPIRPGTKKPSFEKWQGYVSAVPSPARQIEMQNKYGTDGVGVLLGAEVVPGMILVGIDIDADSLVAVVRALLPNADVGKRGKKGETLFGLIPKEQKPKSTTLKGADGLGNIDFLAGGRQAVLNPTMHPETNEPYEAVGRGLAETPPAELPVFDMQQIRVIRALIERPEVLVLQGGQGTHDAGVALVAKLVRAQAADEQITAIIKALLPKGYSGNSIDELPGWIASAREKGFDQGESDESPTLAAQLVNLVRTSAVELFHDREKNSYAALPSAEGLVIHRVDGSAFRQWLRHQFYLQAGRPAGSGPVIEAVATIEAIALFSGPEKDVHLRVAGDRNHVEIDLGRADGAVVQISPSGWNVVPRAINRFIRGAGFQELPEPVRGGSLSELQELLGLDDTNFRLLLCFLINALKPGGPYFILIIEGEQGSGKSFFSQVIKMIIDPNEAMRMRMPERDTDLMIQAKEYRLLNFDNASMVKNDMSDMLCSLATGGGVGVRRLYTNGELHVMSYSRPFMINGITGYANRPDLLERAIPINLPHINDGERRTEGELMTAFLEKRPRILGALYDLISAALRHHSDVEPPRDLRMADAAHWIAGAERGMDITPGKLIATISEAQSDLFVDRVNDEAVVIRIRTILSKIKGPFEGYLGTLFTDLDVSQDRSLPKSASALSKLLRRLAPAMKKAGLVVEFHEKDRKGKCVWIGTPEQVGQPGQPHRSFGA
jgi:hypothetical protein